MQQPRNRPERKSRLIRDLMEEGDRLRMVPLTFIYRSGSSHRFRGVLVSRLVGGAVERNRVKRRLREFLRNNPDWLERDYDVVIRAGKGSEKIKSHRLKELMDEAGMRLAPGGTLR